MRAGRVVSSLWIAVYVGCLAWGIGALALKVGLSGNTLGYFVVWDMFCGWQAFDNRTHIVAEGVSGQYYQVKAPWGEFTPFGNVPRVHYDVTNNLVPRHIRNVLGHTRHEPIDRVYVVQEIWPKQFNIPDRLWSQYFGEPRDKLSYFNLRAICNDQGTVLNSYPDWYAVQTLNSVADNPRLQLAARRSHSLLNTFIKPAQGTTDTSTSFREFDSHSVITN